MFLSKVKDKVMKFHKDEEAALLSTEAIILIAVGGAVAVGIGIFATRKTNEMSEAVDSQLQNFNDFGSGE